MKINEIKSEGLKKEFSIVVPSKAVEGKVTAKISDLAKTAKIPGFRIGHAPAAMLKQKFKASVMGDVLEELVNEATAELLKKEKLVPAMNPDVKVVTFADGKDAEFNVKIESLPKIELQDLSKVSLNRLIADVPDAEVEKTLEYLAKSRRQTVKVEEKRPAKKGDTVVIDFVGSVNGEEFRGGKGANHPLELGSGAFIPGFEDQLIGKQAGDNADVKVTFPKEYHSKDLAGKDALFKVEVKELRTTKKVEINDDFAKDLGEESLDKVKGTIRSRISADYEAASRMKLKRELLDNLDKAYKFELPLSLVDVEYKSIMEQHEHAKAHNQLDPAEANKSEAELKKEYKNLAARRVKLGLLLSEIGKDAKVMITPDDINKAIMMEAKKYPGQEKAVFDFYLKNKQAIEALKAPVFEEKIVDHILSKAKVNDKKVTLEELYSFDEDAKPAKKEKKAEEKSEAKAEKATKAEKASKAEKTDNPVKKPAAKKAVK